MGTLNDCYEVVLSWFVFLLNLDFTPEKMILFHVCIISMVELFQHRFLDVQPSHLRRYAPVLGDPLRLSITIRKDNLGRRYYGWLHIFLWYRSLKNWSMWRHSIVDWLVQSHPTVALRAVLYQSALTRRILKVLHCVSEGLFFLLVQDFAYCWI